MPILLLFCETPKREDAEINVYFDVGTKSVVVAVAISIDSIFRASIENDAFQMYPISNHSTLNSVFKCLCFRYFSMKTSTQKRRHSTPFSYENGVMETGIV